MSSNTKTKEEALIDPINLRLSLIVPRLSEINNNYGGNFQWNAYRSTPVAKEMLNRLMVLADAGMFLINVTSGAVNVALNGMFVGRNSEFFRRFFRLSDIEVGYEYNRAPPFLIFERRSNSGGSVYFNLKVRSANLSHNDYTRFITFDPNETRFGLSFPLMFYSNVIDIFNFLAVCKSELENLHTVGNSLDESTKERVYDFFRNS